MSVKIMNMNYLVATQKSQGSSRDLDEIILQRIESQCFGERTIEIYGGAYHLARRCEPSLAEIAIGALGAIKTAKFFEPNTPSSTVAQRYCSLFYVDHMLIEAYAGVRF